MGTNYDVDRFFNMDLQRESDVIGFEIGDLITGTDLRERSLTRLLTENAVCIFDIAKKYASRSNVIACIFFCVSFFPAFS